MNARAKLDERGAGVMTWNSTQTYLRDAIKFWEPRRVGYNLVLIAVAVFWFAFDWHHFRRGLHPQLILALIVLAILANLCYCAAYLVDIPLQCSRFRNRWIHRRTWLWIAGVLFATLLASYWINDEIYAGIGSAEPNSPVLIRTS